MSEISPFSPEYNIGSATDTNKEEKPKLTSEEDPTKKLENDPHYYWLSKPVRITVKARVIPK